MIRVRLAEHIAGRIYGLRGWRRSATAVLLGALATLALPPFHILPVALVSFTGLLWLAESSRTRWRAFAVGWLFGFAHFVTGLYWVANAFAMAGIAAWAAPLAVAALAATCALFPGLAAAAAAPREIPGMARVAWFACAWVAAEWLRGGVIFGGFPWNLIGYVWMPWESMIQVASAFGIHGLSWLTVLAAAAPAALAAAAPPWRAVAASWLLVLLVAAVGTARLGRAPVGDVQDVRLRLVQANVSQVHKWRDDLRAAHLARHLALSTAPSAHPPTHVIWPETAMPYRIESEPIVRMQVAAAVPADGLLLTGVVRVQESERHPLKFWNSLQAVDTGGAVVANYDKFHLVPFGEYVPLRRLLRIAKVTPGETDFSAGPGPRSLTIPGLPPFSPLICYEAIFSSDVVDRDARPAWMLNITNDGWYGISTGPYQHFQQARLRAVEQGLPMVRVANTGISGVVDGYGRIRRQLGLARSGVIDVALPNALPEPTLFARWGDWPGVAVLLLCLLWLRRARARSGPVRGPA